MSAQEALAAIFREDSAPLGAVAGIARDGRQDIAAAGESHSDGTPMTISTAFDVASVTKVAATSTALLRLVTLGALHFDDPVVRYLPRSGCAEGATIRHLLQHRAGLWEWQPLYLDDREPWQQIDTLPLRYRLGEGRHYSDLGFMLLGRIVCAVAGATLDEAVRELVCDPLGLTRTGYGTVDGPVASSAFGDAAERRMVETGEPYPILAHRSQNTEPRGFAWREDEISGVVNDGNCFHALGGVSGHAGLFSTAADLLRLGSALATDRGDQCLPDARADMFRDGPDSGQALGWRSDHVRVDGREHRMLWHPGFTGCALGVIPETGTAVVLLSNRLMASAPMTTDALWRIAIPALLETPLARMEGTPE